MLMRFPPDLSLRTATTFPSAGEKTTAPPSNPRSAAASKSTAGPKASALGTFLSVLGFLYVLRVPLLIFAATAYATLAAFDPNLPGENILRGIYDVAWVPEPWHVGVRFFLLSL